MVLGFQRPSAYLRWQFRVELKLQIKIWELSTHGSRNSQDIAHTHLRIIE